MTRINILTVDVEDYFQVENFANTIKTSDWGKYESRVVRNTEKILELLDWVNVKTTFFVLGWIAERFPQLVEKIHRAGHEVASHGYSHQLIYRQKPEEFRTDLRKAKDILQDIVQKPVIGYRAPNYSITKKSMWALDILMEEGFKYDSSLFPIHHDKGGLPGTKRFPYKIYNGFGAKEQKSTRAQEHRSTGKLLADYNPEAVNRKPYTANRYLWEFPLSTIRIRNRNIPFSGGGYFRLLPYRFIKWSVEAINKEGRPVVMYIHPWEFDPQQPRIKADYLSRFRHYVNISKTESKLKELVSDFDFKSIRDYLY